MNALHAFNVASRFPLGRWLFSRAVCWRAPYFASIRPSIAVLQPGRVEVKMKNRRRVQNHLQTVHAIAMCNMAELAGGLCTDISIPPGSRWIPAGMTVEYLKKAKTDLLAVADGSGVDWRHSGEVLVPVEVRDTAAQVVFRAHIRMNLKHEQAA